MTTKITRRAALFGGAAATLAAMTGCSNSNTEPETPKPTATMVAMTFGLTFIPNVQFAPAYVAVDEGLFHRENLSITLRHHGQSESLFGALQAGTEQIVFAGGSEVMAARDEDLDVMSFATMYQKYPVSLIVPDDSPIKSPADLKGRSVGIPGPFGENYLALLAMLKQANLPMDQVDVQHIGYTQLAAMQSKRVDSVIGFTNNDAVQMKRAGLAIREIQLPDDAPLVGAGLICKTNMVTEYTDALVRFTKCMAEAIDICRNDPDVAIRATKKHVPGMTSQEDEDAARAVLAATLPLYGEKVGAQDFSRWQAMSGFLAETGITKRKISAEQACAEQISKKL